jgi:hypothetical protein
LPSVTTDESDICGTVVYLYCSMGVFLYFKMEYFNISSVIGLSYYLTRKRIRGDIYGANKNKEGK